MLKTFKVTISTQDAVGENSDFYLCQVKEINGASDTVIHEIRINPNRGDQEAFVTGAVAAIQSHIEYLLTT